MSRSCQVTKATAQSGKLSTTVQTSSRIELVNNRRLTVAVEGGAESVRVGWGEELAGSCAQAYPSCRGGSARVGAPSLPYPPLREVARWRGGEVVPSQHLSPGR
jgi:hypothetical protein